MITVNEVPSIGHSFGQAIVGGMEEGRANRQLEEGLMGLFKDSALARSVRLLDPVSRAAYVKQFMKNRASDEDMRLIEEAESGEKRTSPAMQQPTMSRMLGQPSESYSPVQRFQQPTPSFDAPIDPTSRMGLLNMLAGNQTPMQQPQEMYGGYQDQSASNGYVPDQTPVQQAEPEETPLQKAENRLARLTKLAGRVQNPEALNQRLENARKDVEYYRGLGKVDIDEQKKTQEDERKFNADLSKEIELNSKLVNEAKFLKKLVEDNEDKFNMFRGVTSLSMLKKLEPDDVLRTFDRRVTDILTKAAALGEKSRLTNMGRSWLAEGKMNRTQPTPTIKDALNQFIEEGERPAKELGAYRDLQKEYKGKLPVDFRTKISEKMIQADRGLDERVKKAAREAKLPENHEIKVDGKWYYIENGEVREA